MNKFKKIGLSLMSVLCLFAMTPQANASSGNDSITVQMDVTATISVDCAATTVTLQAITGTGKSTFTSPQNSTTCTVITNNAAGYDLKWASNDGNMTNGSSDNIAQITTNTTPAVWPTITTTNGWGAKLGSDSENYNSTTWGTADDYTASSKWIRVDTGTPYTFHSRTAATDGNGEVERVIFGAEVGTGNITPTGTYTEVVTISATAK